jgi:predicted nucleic acid-binding protein
LKLAIDACSLIILDKGGVLDKVLTLGNHEFFIGSFVEDECGTLAKIRLQQGTLKKLQDERLSLHKFVTLLDRYDLGYGETECIAFCISENISLCSDDAKARKAAETELGASRVVGTLYLLRECVRSNLLTKAEAVLAYEQMRVRGAFLPDWPDGYLDA